MWKQSFDLIQQLKNYTGKQIYNHFQKFPLAYKAIKGGIEIYKVQMKVDIWFDKISIVQDFQIMVNEHITIYNNIMEKLKHYLKINNINEQLLLDKEISMETMEKFHFDPEKYQQKLAKDKIIQSNLIKF